MDLYKPVCRHIIIPLWAAHERSPYLNHLSSLEKSQYEDSEKIRKRQWNAIVTLLSHAYRHTIFYRKRFDKSGIHPNDIRTWEDFQNAPILTKEDVRNHRGTLFADNFDKYIKFFTSGSTGIPIEGYRD